MPLGSSDASTGPPGGLARLNAYRRHKQSNYLPSIQLASVSSGSTRRSASSRSRLRQHAGDRAGLRFEGRHSPRVGDSPSRDTRWISRGKHPPAGVVSSRFSARSRAGRRNCSAGGQGDAQRDLAGGFRLSARPKAAPSRVYWPGQSSEPCRVERCRDRALGSAEHHLGASSSSEERANENRHARAASAWPCEPCTRTRGPAYGHSFTP
jgi:hypothetical protein